MPPYIYRVTKYDPADRDESGHYVGTEDTDSDRGPVEAAYLQAVATFAGDAGIDSLTIREPTVAGSNRFGAAPAAPGHGLVGIFPPDLTGYHDGADVTLDVAQELVRAMLRETGAWCRLEVDDRFTVHVGWDQYVYISTHAPSEDALACTRELGLFPEPLDASPYDAEFDEYDVEQRPADDDFWARLRWSVAMGQTAILEETAVAGVPRWHRLTRDTMDSVRSHLAPRAMLTVWPDLSTDLAAVVDELPEEGLADLVWERDDGRIAGVTADDAEFGELAALIRSAKAAAVSFDGAARQPLFTAVLPDHDGALRARWRTEPTESDRRWAVLKTLRRGQVCTGTVTDIPPFQVTFVDIGGVIGQINVSELSWRHIDHPTDIVAVGQEVTVQILDVDMVRERVALSLRAAERNPLEAFVERVGQIVTGPVTKVLPIGVVVRIEDCADGFEGLLLNEAVSDMLDHIKDGFERQVLDETDRGPLAVGDVIAVRIVEVDPSRRHIRLAHADPPREEPANEDQR
ncbi:S1 RNA-binding domain-containing protein [Glycomyces tritici]|uniref:S1 RNA-binding domain-containing protein n=1 Tax=Glycomyces tritici TaxID=2665176 RepID=A0ABT7YWN0_9ACTN|nr:S1 RNA-binding domain-containing protein [Glycomyces tritici]MDN3243042.1 S1 RNA-binding domain-containing protein [Glycomyces tritici]